MPRLCPPKPQTPPPISSLPQFPPSTAPMGEWGGPARPAPRSWGPWCHPRSERGHEEDKEGPPRQRWGWGWLCHPPAEGFGVTPRREGMAVGDSDTPTPLGTPPRQEGTGRWWPRPVCARHRCHCHPKRGGEGLGMSPRGVPNWCHHAVLSPAGGRSGVTRGGRGGFSGS